MPEVNSIDLGAIMKNAKSLGGESGLEQTKDTLSLVNIINQIQAAPLDRKTKEVDFALKGNQLLNIEVENELKRTQLFNAKKQEERDQLTFFTNQVKELPTVLGTNFELGKMALQRLLPGSEAIKNADGTVSVMMGDPQAGTELKTLTIDPNRVSDPKQRVELENGWRKEFDTDAKGFEVQSQYFRNLTKLASLGTAQADIGIIFSYMKLLDPNSVVREGEQATAVNSPGVPERIRNMYNRALTADAPLFGPVGSATRSKFIEAGKVLYDNAETDTLKTGNYYYNLAERSGFRPENVVKPLGGLTIEDFKAGAKEGGQSQPPSGAPAGQLPPKQNYEDLLKQQIFGE